MTTVQNSKTDFNIILKKSFRNYAEEVILHRAIPDVRDGLKPVHRRILFDMLETGLVFQKPHKKCAKVVGDVLGRFHPHGDTSVYDALVRLAQPFSTRYPLIDSQGNFGSIDGSKSAAYRYTEARLSSVGEILLGDVTKPQFVDFETTYDESESEPTVLGGWFPNLLVNGTQGIAIGMATNIPPHNYQEVANALIHYIKNPTCTVNELLSFLPAPDFPTGCLLEGDFLDLYQNGKGSVKVTSRYEILPKKNSDLIIFKEIPYGKRTDTLLEGIDKVLRDHPDVLSIRDESDQDVRLVIEVVKGMTDSVIAILYSKTELSVTFHFNFLVIVDGKPEICNLKKLFKEYAKHQITVLRKKLDFDIEKISHDIHILQGWLRVVDQLDLLIEVIRSSEDRKEALSNLLDKFSISEEQGNVIVNTRLEQLTKKRIEARISDLARFENELIKLESIRSSNEKQADILVQRLEEGKQKFTDPRQSLLSK